tara:strand:- start:770 stop:1057 length:288 start_codon:yes stop_codon:yes gene_type:complete
VAAALGTHSATELVLMHRVTTLEQVVDQLLSLFYRPAARDSRVASSGGDVVERGDSGGCDDGGGGGSRIRRVVRRAGDATAVRAVGGRGGGAREG